MPQWAVMVEDAASHSMPTDVVIPSAGDAVDDV